MNINNITKQDDNIKTSDSIKQLNKLIDILNAKNLPESYVENINSEIKDINTSELTDKSLFRLIKNRQNKMIILISKDLKLVPKNYYKKLWLVLGISVFGLPIGVIIGTLTGNIGLLGIGFPFGMLIGLMVGKYLDKKALDNDKQIVIELN